MKLLVTLVTLALATSALAQTCDCSCNGGNYCNNIDSSSYCTDVSPCDVCGPYCCGGQGYQWTCYDNGSSGTGYWFIILASAVCAVIWTAWIYRRRQMLGLPVDQCRMTGHCIGCFCCPIIWCCIYFCIESSESSNRAAWRGQPGVVAQPVIVQPGSGQVVMAQPVYVQQAYGQPGYAQPGYAQPGYAQAYPAQGGFAQPGTYAAMPAGQQPYGTTAYAGQPPAYTGQPYTMQPEGGVVMAQPVGQPMMQQPAQPAPGTM